MRSLKDILDTRLSSPSTTNECLLKNIFSFNLVWPGTSVPVLQVFPATSDGVMSSNVHNNTSKAAEFLISYHWSKTILKNNIELNSSLDIFPIFFLTWSIVVYYILKKTRVLRDDRSPAGQLLLCKSHYNERCGYRFFVHPAFKF